MSKPYIFQDERLRLNGCIYCGGEADTKEHIPPKVFLDTPYPDYLPVVPACMRCNNEKAPYEEYLACFLECVTCGTTDISNLEREKIKRTLQHHKNLQSEIEKTKRSTPDGLVWTPEQDKIHFIAVKLAQGHIAHEEFAMLEEPASVCVHPVRTLPSDIKSLFSNEEEFEEAAIWPEIGSRGFHRTVVAGNSAFAPSWIDVQKGRYRYKVIQSSAVAIVIREYLGIYVAWE